MITDRLTARVLGLLVIVLTLLIVASCFMFARPETRNNPRFAVIVILPSLPLFLGGALLLRKAERMKEDED
ncbi:MAG: hypothetical protein KF819_13610 [Labilithrix sp.]|nr:hypothetical protein [Labilithrix sp.]